VPTAAVEVGETQVPHEDISPARAPLSRLIEGLDSDFYMVREQSEARLTELGRASLPAVLPACRHASPEVRRRARRILQSVLHPALVQGFRQLAACERDEDIDLEAGMCLIAQIVQPLVEPEPIQRKLDDFAQRVKKHLGDPARPREVAPAAVLAAIRQVLALEEKLTGNEEHYDLPENSSIAHVLATRKGLPITLSQIVLSVGKRLDLPLVGIPVPGHFMVKYDGSLAPPGQPTEDLLLDPFRGCAEVSLQELRIYLAQRGHTLVPAEHLKPATRREMLQRMLRNLSNDYQIQGDVARAQQAEEYYLLFEKRPSP